MKGENEREKMRGNLLVEEGERACLLKLSLLYAGSINPYGIWRLLQRILNSRLILSCYLVKRKIKRKGDKLSSCASPFVPSLL